MSAAENVGEAVRTIRDISPRGAESELQAAFVQHYARIVGVLCRILGDRSRAEELANDVFWRLYRMLPQSDGNIAGWLYRTATNLGIDALRASARRRKYEQAAVQHAGAETGAGPLQDILRREQRDRVRAVLASIKPQQAQILILRASGFSYKELAGALDVKSGGIGTMLNRAEAEFRKRYLELHGHEEDI